MRIISNAMLIVSGVYLALGVIYLRFWWAERSRLSYLAFTVSCFSYMIFSWFERGMLHSQTPEAYLFYVWWAPVVGFVGIISFGWFAYLHLHGRKWLLWAHSVLRTLALLIHLIMAKGIHFRQITSVGSRTVLGETLSYPIGVSNPWSVLPQFCNVILVIFFLDTSIRCWRRGERRQALVFGTGTLLFGMVTVIAAPLILWGFLPFPLMNTFTVLFIIVAMLLDLNYELHHAAMLTEKLAERDSRLTETLGQLQLSAADADVGMWTRRIDEETIWMSERAGEIWGFPSGQSFTRKDLFQNIHPDDRELFRTIARDLEGGETEFQVEYRILRNEGNIRWIHSRGKVESANGSRTIRGAIVDITNLKLAEEAVRELSHKLINAQENERARLARELHDDLSQSIALLSMQMTRLRNESKSLDYVKDQLDHLISDVYRMVGDVRRISHELHPAMLSQLGLEAALRDSLREVSAAHPLEIGFKAENLSRNLPEDVSLCLYRVTQESVQNVIKHSAATSAQVTIKAEHGKIHLSVSDNGHGFDREAARGKDSLGLISIDERVRAVKGEAKVISAVGAGTKIEVHIPFGNGSEEGSK